MSRFPQMVGKVLWFNIPNGYGFIKGEDGADYFAHFSKIQAEPGEFRVLEQGDVVEFEPTESDRGNGVKKPQALSIKVVVEGAKYGSEQKSSESPVPNP